MEEEVKLNTAMCCGRISAACDMLRGCVHGKEAIRLIEEISKMEKKIMDNEIERLRAFKSGNI